MPDKAMPSQEPGPFSRPLRLARLNRQEPHGFAERPEREELEALAAHLGASGVAKMRWEGTLHPIDGDGWRLEARLGATVTQPCVATLAPVRSRIDIAVGRTFLPDTAQAVEAIDIDPEEAEEIDPLPAVLDIGAIAVEELALALPAYPRADGAQGDGIDRTARPPGAAPIEDDVVKPFAGLAALRAAMGNDDSEPGS